MKFHVENLRIPVACLILILVIPIRLHSQTGAELVLDSASLESQFEFMTERTRTYDGYRAIRDDLYRTLSGNAIDSLNAQKLETETLKSQIMDKDQQIGILNTDLERARNERDQAIRTKDSFDIMGLQLQKGVYNMVMWILVLGLLVLGILLFAMFKRSHVVTQQTRKELENLKAEFEEYRKSSREKYEKMVVSHHNEIMKLKKS